MHRNGILNLVLGIALGLTFAAGMAWSLGELRRDQENACHRENRRTYEACLNEVNCELEESFRGMCGKLTRVNCPNGDSPVSIEMGAP